MPQQQKNNTKKATQISNCLEKFADLFAEKPNRKLALVSSFPLVSAYPSLVLSSSPFVTSNPWCICMIAYADNLFLLLHL